MQTVREMDAKLAASNCEPCHTGSMSSRLQDTMVGSKYVDWVLHRIGVEEPTVFHKSHSGSQVQNSHEQKFSCTSNLVWDFSN